MRALGALTAPMTVLVLVLLLAEVVHDDRHHVLTRALADAFVDGQGLSLDACQHAQVGLRQRHLDEALPLLR